MNVLSFLDSKGVSYRLTSGNKEATFTCPECGENGKFYVNIDSGAFICFRASCDTQGGWKDLLRLLGEESNNIKLEVSTKPAEIEDPEPIDISVVDELNKTLLQRFKSFEDYFTNKRGFTIETIKKFKLGWDGRNIVIPIFDEKGNCVNFKYKSDPTRPNPAKGIFSITGRGRMRLFNVRVLLTETKPDYVIICEGEWDCMKLDQEGFVAVTSTGGAGSWKDEWTSLFKDIKKVYICMDNDANKAGQKGSLKIAKKYYDQK